jgi:hypothetical protein
MYASYYAQLRYYGVPRPDEPAEQFGKELANQRVQYLLIWGNQELPNSLDWQRLNAADATLPAIYANRR